MLVTNLSFPEINWVIKKLLKLYQIKIVVLAISKWEKNKFEIMDFVGRLYETVYHKKNPRTLKIPLEIIEVINAFPQ